MIIESSHQVPRGTLLKRFPVPRNFGVAPGSRIDRGKTWPAPAGAVCVKSFEIYRAADVFGPGRGSGTSQPAVDVSPGVILTAVITASLGLLMWLDLIVE